MMKSITVEVTINAPVEKAWESFTTPNHITKWNFASSDWECPSAENDLKTGGKFRARMQDKNTKEGFDFGGTYTNVILHKLIEYEMDDKRKVSVKFESHGDKTKVIETFDTEITHSEEQQREGWQSILDNFKKHTETSR